MNNLEPVNQPLSAGQRVQSQQSQFQHHAWLLEMERALLQANQLHSQPERDKPLPKNPAPASALPTSALPPQAAEALDTATESIPAATGFVSPAAQAGAMPGQADPGQKPAGAVADAQAPHIVTSVPAMAHSAVSSSATSRSALFPADMGAAGMPAVQMALALSAISHEQPDSADSQTGALAAAFAGNWQQNPMAGNVARNATAAMPPSLQTPLPAGLTVRASLPMPFQFMHAEAAPSPPASATLEHDGQDEARNSATARPGEEQIWTRRQLHVYQHAEGVQAWLRDADLDPAQIVQVAQAMGLELSNAGYKLKALSVNGRKVIGTDEVIVVAENDSTRHERTASADSTLSA
ncbi:MAG: hypothetical protein RL748_4194 [Pseudomonadota bacterium]